MKNVIAFIALFAAAISAATATPAPAPAPVSACKVEDWRIIESTVACYIDVVNGKEVRKCRAEAITPTACTPLDSLKTTP